MNSPACDHPAIASYVKGNHTSDRLAAALADNVCGVQDRKSFGDEWVASVRQTALPSVGPLLAVLLMAVAEMVSRFNRRD